MNYLFFFLLYVIILYYISVVVVLILNFEQRKSVGVNLAVHAF